MEDITKIVKSREDSALLLKGVTETVQNEVKNKQENFLICYQVHQVEFYQEIF